MNKLFIITDTHLDKLDYFYNSPDSSVFVNGHGNLDAISEKIKALKPKVVLLLTDGQLAHKKISYPKNIPGAILG